MEAIILAGGLGKRLKEVVANTPKPMASIENKPFLAYIIDFLLQNNVSKVFLSVGYKHSIIKNYFKDNYHGCNIEYIVEHQALGTGGAILNSLPLVSNENVLVLNGDTFFPINLHLLLKHHLENHALLTVALKEMYDFDRYGNVVVDQDGVIETFQEKCLTTQGYINGGIYVINKKIFEGYKLKIDFSFERFLAHHAKQLKACSVIFNDYFIDIGIPNDYYKASQDFKSFEQKKNK